LALRAERELLRHSGALADELGRVRDEIAGDDGGGEGLVRRTGRAQAVLERWRERLESLGSIADALGEARVALEEAGRGLERFLEGVEASPARLEEVEARLYAIEELARRLRVRPDELALRAAELEAEIAALSGDEAARDELERELERARAGALEQAKRLSRARRALVAPIEKAVRDSLAALGLGKARFALALDTAPGEAGDPPGPGGMERAEMQLAANPGEPLQPLRAVASGGEAARILLALRTALAVRRTIPTLVFDEVDANVGGRLGPKVGEHLAALARHHQVLCVTHLPAIAARAERHHRVAKQVAKGRTRTTVEELEGEARVAEIADMIAGGAAEATARAEAERLLGR
jgi:DNA repair protein RecN (Recombination protein N)